MDPRVLRAVLWAMLLSASGCAAPHRLSIHIMPPLIPAPAASVLWLESFAELSPEQWREVEVRRRTEYRAARVEGRACLEARSRNGASVLLHPIQFDPGAYEWLSWDWRVDQPVAGEDLTKKAGSDAPARLYVYFNTHGLPWQKRSLDYVWSSALPPGTVLHSAFSPESAIIVLEGASAPGHWRHERRNLRDDYRRCFDGAMPEVIALGIMTDTDNTRGEALAYYADLRVGRGESGRAR